MKPEDFDFIGRLVRSRSGLVLPPEKAYLLESRLMPVARHHRLKGLDELIQMARVRRDETLIGEIVEAMATSESSFFRDIKPYELFRRQVLAHLLQARAATRAFRIWSTAAATGQEPYSIAMCLREEAARLDGWHVEIVASDLSRRVLEKAREGLYSQFEVQRGLPIQMLLRHFAKENGHWRIDAGLRAMVEFRPFNLLDDPRPLGRFDVIFCRNVLIYFDQETKAKVLDGLIGVLPPDGVLFLGGAETVLGVTERFKPIPGQRGIYCRADAGGAMPRLDAAS